MSYDLENIKLRRPNIDPDILCACVGICIFFATYLNWVYERFNV